LSKAVKSRRIEMQPSVTSFSLYPKHHTNKTGEPCVGHLVEITSDGQAMVDYRGNHGEPVPARSILAGLPGHANIIASKQPVLLVFDNGDPNLPIIVGIVNKTLFHPPDNKELTLHTKRRELVTKDNKSIVIDAEKEILLRCGKSSITLKKNGKVVIKGAEIVSRAAKANKIKGAVININ
jgi:hypothetical protein